MPEDVAEFPDTVCTGIFRMPGILTRPTAPHVRRLMWPKAKGSVAAVALIHGSGPNDRDETLGENKPFRDLAWGLAQRGIAVLRFDKRTFTYGANCVERGDSMTLDREVVDDAVSAINLLRKTAGIDARRLFVLGHSLGAMAAPKIASKIEKKLAGIILMAGPARQLLDVAKDQIDFLMATAADSVRQASFDDLVRQAPQSYWNSLASYNQVNTAASLRIPILLLQGERDYQVLPKELSIWRDGLNKKRNVVIKTYPKLNHLFMEGEGAPGPSEYQNPGHIPNYVLDDIASFVKNAR